jgi:ATP-dependent Clp protease, protease subunit
MKPLALRKGMTGLTSFNAKANSDELVLEAYDVIGADFFGEGITVKSVSDALKSAGEYSKVTLRINSPGGDLFEGVAIYNVLRGLGKPVNVLVDGLAASAASLIAMAGDSIEMGEGSMIMIHNAMMLAMGNGTELRKAADVLDTVSASAADIYVSRTKLEKSDVTTMMDEETWLSAQEAVDKGFATAVTKSKSNGKAKAMASFDLSAFNNVPEELKMTAEEPEYVEDFRIAIFRKRLDLLRNS